MTRGRVERPEPGDRVVEPMMTYLCDSKIKNFQRSSRQGDGLWVMKGTEAGVLLPSRSVPSVEGRLPLDVLTSSVSEAR